MIDRLLRLLTSRVIFAIVFLGCVFLMAVALYLEHVMNLEPCPLCLLQRVFVVAAGVFALLASLQNPGLVGIRVYGGLVILSAAVGGAIAIRQLWLQSLPEDQVPACAPSLDYMLDVFGPLETLTTILSADGNCAEVMWTFLGLSIPGWTLVGFLGLAAIGGFQVVRPRA